MLTFFTKKDFLVDHIEGLIDIHNHILPGIDDGAKIPEESIQLIKEFRNFGVKDFICTPHIIHNYYDNTPKTVKESFRKLKKALREKAITNVNLKFAAEHMIDDNFEGILKDDNIIPLNSNHLLIEMSYLQPSINFESAVGKIQTKNYFPVFAHPERYHYLINDYGKYEYYKSIGIKFQLNMLSLSGYYGSEIHKTAIKLLNAGFYDFIGTDVHNLTHIQSLKSVKINKSVATKLFDLIANNQTFSLKYV